MRNPNNPSILLFTFSVFSLLYAAAAAAVPPTGPLYTSSRWIVDGSGRRVKLVCVNWPSHMEVAVAEGLSHQPMDTISKTIAALGFNCVRLTWPTYLVTNGTVANMTVRASFETNGLGLYVSGLEANNPTIVDLPLIKAFQAVVRNLAENKLMIILDNHVTRPGWCCSDTDGNGFFGDKYFEPELWLQGLREMATMFNVNPNVVAMSLRNELRGPKQNAADWYRYVQRGAEIVHASNPNVLIILSGLSYDLDLSFLKTRPVTITFASRRKLAFEVHWYSFSGGRGSWGRENANEVCGKSVVNKVNKALFLLNQGWPVILTEFGADLTGRNENDNRFFSCLVGLAAELDLDWAYWEIGGSYYRRYNVIGMNETYGMLTSEWTSHNTPFMQQISSIQAPFQGPGVGNSTKMNQAIFHPLSGNCIVRIAEDPYQLILGPCSESEAWRYDADNGTLALYNGTAYLYLQAQGQGKTVMLVDDETASHSTWKQISSSGMHLSTQLNDVKRNGTLLVCLDVGDDDAVMADDCKCLSKDIQCNPASQWFRIINSSRTVTKLIIQKGKAKKIPIHV
ncbi:hypothetical protein V2J09_012854 [Rumex salicifolius]